MQIADLLSALRTLEGKLAGCYLYSGLLNANRRHPLTPEMATAFAYGGIPS